MTYGYPKRRRSKPTRTRPKPPHWDEIEAMTGWETPTEYQALAALDRVREQYPDVRVVSFPWARQTGKTIYARREGARAAHETEPGGVNQYSTPTFVLGRKPFRELYRLSKIRQPDTRAELAQANRSERIITWTWFGAIAPENAALTQFKTFHPDPGDVVSETLSRLGIYDESGRIPAEGWDFADPMHDAHDAMSLRIGTPRGKRTRYYEEYLLGLDVDGNSPLLSGKPPTNPRYLSMTVTAEMAHDMGLAHHRPDQLEAKRAVMSPLLYRQEYECEWMDGAVSPFGDLEAVHVTELETPTPEGVYCLGVDLAKHQDFTAIRVLRVDCWPFREVAFWRAQELDWRVQRIEIARWARRWNEGRTAVDATGLGEPVCDELEYMGVRLERVNFTAGSKNALVDNLIAKLGGGMVQLLRKDIDPVAFGEMWDYEVDVKTIMRGRMVTGVDVSYGHPEGRHDDTVMARALAVWAATADRGLLQTANVW